MLRKDWPDYGARMYDAQLGRFMTLDPLAETYNFQSPYVYALNNPIRYTDYLGMGPNDEVKVNEIKNNDDGSITINETNINTEKNNSYTTDSDGNVYRHEKTTTTTTNSTTTIDKDGNIVEDKTKSSATSSSETVTYREERKTGTSDQVISHYVGRSETDPVPVASGNNPGIAATNISNDYDAYVNLVKEVANLDEQIKITEIYLKAGEMAVKEMNTPDANAAQKGIVTGQVIQNNLDRRKINQLKEVKKKGVSKIVSLINL
jgi:hypothetical protein